MVGTGPDAPAALLEQSRTVCEWLAGLTADDFGHPTALSGWDVRTLTGHLVLVHRGLGQVLGRPTGDRPLPNSEFVRRYRRDI
ncbi:MAG TPA: maleylpyruvate isomerase N-terminal domain-containing protein, partial [Propionibacteriaceae bacterium]|nr:maleylpyruvate isomerase N-terminal domain-containing protein [Propionibacteriaceae bacterium]